MAKKRRPQSTPARSAGSAGNYPVVGARQPCPCGSGRRYKACHGREAAHAATELVRRPFEGLPNESDWVALRELVPAGTARLTLKEGLPEGVPAVTLATVLPMAWPALRRESGEVLLGLQNDTASGDISRDLADTLGRALTAEPGTPVDSRPDRPAGAAVAGSAGPGGSVRARGTQRVRVLDRGGRPARGEVAASLESANSAAIPTARLSGVEGAYWCEAPEKNHLRWVMTHPEERLLDALARLHAQGASTLGEISGASATEGSRLVGSFRAHGLTVPVWDLPSGMTSEDCEKPAAAFAERLAEALAATTPLTAEERRARSGLTNRQVTLS